MWNRPSTAAIGTTPHLAQKLVFCNSDLDKSITVCEMGSERFPQNLFGFGKSIHLHKVHIYEVYAHKVHTYAVHAHEVHACEMHVYEVHTHEMRACELHA